MGDAHLVPGSFQTSAFQLGRGGIILDDQKISGTGAHRTHARPPFSAGRLTTEINRPSLRIASMNWVGSMGFVM